MTFEQTAREIASRFQFGTPYTVTNRERMRIWIEDALRTAVSEERERCARLAERCELGNGDIAEEIAMLIRKGEGA